MVLAALLVVGVVLAGVQPGGATSGDVLGYLLNYGVLGLFAVLWLTNRIKTAADVTKAEARAEAAEARERALNDTLRTETMPALVRFTDTATRILDRDSR